MKKNDKSLISGLTIQQLEDQKEKLQKEIENVERAKQQLSIKSYAIAGAIQQCDIFITMLNEKDSEANPVSSIPSQDDSTALNTVFS